jgi:centromere protein I
MHYDKMSTKEMAIKYFKNLKGKKTVNRVEFSTCLNELKNKRHDGFTEKEVETLIDALVSIKNLGSVRFQGLLECIVPYKMVPSKATLILLQWLFTYYHTAPIGSVKSALEWIIGLIEFGLTDDVSVHAFYHHFYLLLEVEKLALPACKLIHLLTIPSDVSRWRVKRILKIEQKVGKKNHTTCLLCLFKSYKPECVPERIPAVNIQVAFKAAGKMNQFFQQARLRLGAGDVDQGNGEMVKWNVDQGVKRTRKKTKVDAIPSLDYVHFGSELYREKKLHSLLEFKTLKSLSAHQLNLDIPCNSLSLLQNMAGIHVLAFGDRSLQSRFSFNLYYTLHRAFFEQDNDFSYKEKENLLKQTVALEEYMQQGIPVVSRFLAEYLPRWDGEDFQETIFHLLQWVTFSSYLELRDLILYYVRNLFMTSGTKVKCSIIAMLNRFVQNLVSSGLFRKHKEISGLFLDTSVEWNEIETLQDIIRFVTDLCVSGLIVEQGNYLLLHETLRFFEMATHSEEENKLSMWTMMPPAVVYNGLFSRNACFLARVCDLLLKYDTSRYPRIRELGLRTKFKKEVICQQLYIADFMNSLWNQNSFVT